jgi:hypothetical protein
MRRRFPTQLQRLAESEPSPLLKLTASRAVELWSLLSAAQVEAELRHDDRLSFRLSLIDAAISVAREDEPEPA